MVRLYLTVVLPREECCGKCACPGLWGARVETSSPTRPVHLNALAAVAVERRAFSHRNGAMRGVYHRAGPPGPASGRPDGRLRPDPVAYCAPRSFRFRT